MHLLTNLWLHFLIESKSVLPLNCYSVKNTIFFNIHCCRFFFRLHICLDPWLKSNFVSYFDFVWLPTGRSIIFNNEPMWFSLYCKLHPMIITIIIIVDHEMLRWQNRTKHSSRQESEKKEWRMKKKKCHQWTEEVIMRSYWPTAKHSVN